MRPPSSIAALLEAADISSERNNPCQGPGSEVNRRVYSSPACHFLTFGLVLPVLPLDVIDFQVSGNGCANGWKKILLAKLR